MDTSNQKYRISLRRVSADFRGIINSHFPSLGKNEPYWNMFGYLAFGNSLDKISGNLKIPAGLLACMEGKDKQIKSRNYVGGNFLKAFIKDVQKFNYSDWDSEERLCRIVTRLVWPEVIAKAIQDEIDGKWKGSPKVYLHTGELVTAAKEARIREMIRQEALETLQYAKSELVESLLLLLNNQPQNRFRKTIVHFNEALEVAKSTATDPAREIALLNLTVYEYQPFYQCVPSSSRIYPLGDNILGTQREVRKTMTQDFLEFDLRSAQAAIAATTWNIPKLKKFLKGGGSFWDYIFKGIDLEFSEDRKSILKDAVYALMYGSSKGKIKSSGKSGLMKILDELDYANSTQDLYEKFISLPLIHSIKLARGRMFKKIKKTDGAKTCLGQWIDLNTDPKKRNDSLRSILSQLNQAYELKLLEPVIKLALIHAGIREFTDSELAEYNYGSSFSRGFSITYWQHDGFSIAPKNADDRQRIIDNLQYLVKKQAESLGIITELELVKP